MGGSSGQKEKKEGVRRRRKQGSQRKSLRTMLKKMMGERERALFLLSSPSLRVFSSRDSASALVPERYKASCEARRERGEEKTPKKREEKTSTSRDRCRRSSEQVMESVVSWRKKQLVDCLFYLLSFVLLAPLRGSQLPPPQKGTM